MIYAIVTLYKPNSSVYNNIIKISEQVDYIFLCDNSENNNQELFKNIKESKYIYNDSNLGLSKAFNKVLKNTNFGFKDDDFIIFFDQDSSIKDNHINVLISDYIFLEERNYDVGCLGPVFYNTSYGDIEIAKNRVLLEKNLYSVQSLITSSMLSRYGNLKKIEFWNENVFLDLADWDLCWRFIEKNFLCCISKNVVLQHSVGESEKKIGRIRLRVGKIFRDYYQIRESLYLIGKKYVPVRFKIKLLEILTVRLLARIIFLGNRKERLYYTRIAVTHFLKGKHGELSHHYIYK